MKSHTHTHSSLIVHPGEGIGDGTLYVNPYAVQSRQYQFLSTHPTISYIQGYWDLSQVIQAERQGVLTGLQSLMMLIVRRQATIHVHIRTVVPI